jgi:hypothetical protein
MKIKIYFYENKIHNKSKLNKYYKIITSIFFALKILKFTLLKSKNICLLLN